MSSSPQLFLERTKNLYTVLEEWLLTTSLKISYEEVQIVEEACGAYRAPVMVIKDEDGRLVARMVPVAANVIGAYGRIDLMGRHDKLILAFLSGEIRQDAEVDAPDWYWIDDSRRGKAHRLKREIFCDLLAEVSDYVFK